MGPTPAKYVFAETFRRGPGEPTIDVTYPRWPAAPTGRPWWLLPVASFGRPVGPFTSESGS